MFSLSFCWRCRRAWQDLQQQQTLDNRRGRLFSFRVVPDLFVSEGMSDEGFRRGPPSCQCRREKVFCLSGPHAVRWDGVHKCRTTRLKPNVVVCSYQSMILYFFPTGKPQPTMFWLTSTKVEGALKRLNFPVTVAPTLHCSSVSFGCVTWGRVTKRQTTVKGRKTPRPNKFSGVHYSIYVAGDKKGVVHYIKQTKFMC